MKSCDRPTLTFELLYLLSFESIHIFSPHHYFNCVPGGKSDACVFQSVFLPLTKMVKKSDLSLAKGRKHILGK